MVICLERDADLHMAQLMALPLTVSCFSKIQTRFTFLVPAYSDSPRKGPLNRYACACARARAHARVVLHIMSSLPAAAVTYVLGCVSTSGTQSGISLTACCEMDTNLA